MLFDSNVLILAAKHSFPNVVEMLGSEGAATASLVRIEVYGYHQLSGEEQSALDALFGQLLQYELTAPVIDAAIAIRRKHRTRLADAIIAATAIVYDVPLVTRNIADFRNIEGLRILDPMGNDDG